MTGYLRFVFYSAYINQSLNDELNQSIKSVEEITLIFCLLYKKEEKKLSILVGN